MNKENGTEQRTGSRVRFGVMCALVGALVAGPLVVGAYALGSKVATNRAVSAIVGAGVMTTFPDGFRPNDVVTRGALATALLRSIPRLATASFDGNADAGSSVELDTVDLRIDGARHKIQGVLISVQLQLDHDNSLSGGCTPSFSLTRNASPMVIGGWSQEEYGGTGSGLELNVAFSIFVKQSTNTKATYHLRFSNPCTSALFVDEGMMTAQSFPLTGAGTAVKATASLTRHGNLFPQHDRS